MSVGLHASRLGSGPPVLLLHGLFGSGANLGALARALQDRFTVFSLDLPNHGRSDWLEEGSLDAMAGAVAGWMQHHGLQAAALVGHSLGGKVAMELALRRPALARALVVADIAPVPYPAHHDEVFAALDAVAAADCRSRQEAAQLMAGHLAEPAVVQFLLTSLQRRSEGTYRWRFNLEGLKRDYRMVRDAPDPAAPYRGPVLFVKGGASDYIREAHRTHILALFPRADVKVMPGCGHWLHAERPALFNGIVRRFLEQHAI